MRYCTLSIGIGVLFSLLCAALPPEAIGQGVTDGETEAQTLPSVTVKDFRLTAPHAPLAQTATTVDRSRIAERDPSSVPQLLQGVGGAFLDQAIGPGGFASLYLRGADPSATLVLIDGVRVNNATNTRGGAFDFGLLDPATIEKVEIVPGARSAVYGPDALAGVVKITTRLPHGSSAGTHINASTGGRGYRSAVMDAGGSAAEALTLTGGGAATQDGPWQNESSSKSASLWSKGEVRSRGTAIFGTLRGTTRKAKSFPDDSGGVEFAVRRELESRDSDSILASMTALHDLASAQLTAFATAANTRDSSDSPGVAPGIRDPFGIPPNRFEADYDRYTIGATASHRPHDSSLVFGIEYQHESGRSASELLLGSTWVPGSFALSRSTRSAFADAMFELTSQATVQGAFRADWVEGLGVRPTMNLGANIAVPDSNASLRASIGTAFKPPSFYALSNPIVGNPDLRPEISITTEIGLASSAPSSSFRYSTAIFASRFNNLVDFDAGPPPRLVNRARVLIKGIDALTEYRAMSWSVGATLTLLEFDLPAGQDALRNRPSAQARIFASMSIASALSLNGTLSWQARIYDSSVPTGPQYLPSAAWIDFTASYRLGDVTARCAVDNVLDEEYRQVIGFPALLRRFRASIEVAL